MSLPQCPKPGSCLDLEPRVERLEEDVHDIKTSLASIHTSVTVLATHRERADKQWGWFWAMGGALLLMGITNLGTFYYFQGQTAERFENLRSENSRMISLISDHEGRLRVQERKP